MTEATGTERPLLWHQASVYDESDKTVILPNPHHGEDISVDFLARFLRDGGISREEWFSTE